MCRRVSVDPTVVVESPGNRVVRAGSLLVQVRWDVLDHTVLEQLQRYVASVARGTKLGFAAVLEEHAGFNRPDVRWRQKELIQRCLVDFDARVAVLIAGEGVASTMLRSVARLLVRSPVVRITSSPREAADWLASHIAVAPTEVERVVAYARRR